MLWIARTLTLLAFAACAPAAEPADSTGIPGPSVVGAGVSGVVRVVGSAPLNVQVVLQTPDGRTLRLTGPLRDELANLAGAEVEVAGEVAPSSDPLAAGELRATGYTILAVDGESVITGEIVAVDGRRARLRTDAGDEVVLEVPQGTFRVGQRVWVQGPRTIAVQSFGILRP